MLRRRQMSQTTPPYAAPMGSSRGAMTSRSLVTARSDCDREPGIPTRDRPSSRRPPRPHFGDTAGASWHHRAPARTPFGEPLTARRGALALRWLTENTKRWTIECPHVSKTRRRASSRRRLWRRGRPTRDTCRPARRDAGAVPSAVPSARRLPDGDTFVVEQLFRTWPGERRRQGLSCEIHREPRDGQQSGNERSHEGRRRGTTRWWRVNPSGRSPAAIRSPGQPWR